MPDRATKDGATGSTGSNAPEFTVSELSGAIKRTLEEGFGYVRLRGEVSGYRGPHSSGHCYFGLKDERAKIDAVMWRGVFQKLKVKPEEGMEVVAHGRVTTYPGSSKYQIVIERLEPAGVGALMALLEERKKKLGAEGLFDESRKKPLPFLPKVVGIITSPTGAVIRDMLHGFEERFPVHVVVWPVRVQGDTCGAEVANAIAGFSALPRDGGAVARPDVLIVARGGGSLEDLWGFNEENVVRAAAASDIPVISAVGHETDWTLVDLAADARAPTPTKAAEWAVPKYSELVTQMGSLRERIQAGILRTLDGARSVFKAAGRGLPRREEIIGLVRQRFDAVERRLAPALAVNTRTHALRHTKVSGKLGPALYRSTSVRRAMFERFAGRLQPMGLRQGVGRSREILIGLDGRLGRAFGTRVTRARGLLDARGHLLTSLSHQGVLKRGFALVREKGGAMLRRAGHVSPGATLEIEFSDGRVVASDARATTREVSERQKQVRLPRKPKGPDQGSLF